MSVYSDAETGDYMTRVTTITILASVIGSSGLSPIEAQRSSPLFGSLEPGRYAVGFTTKVFRDSTRFDLPKINAMHGVLEALCGEFPAKSRHDVA